MHLNVGAFATGGVKTTVAAAAGVSGSASFRLQGSLHGGQPESSSSPGRATRVSNRPASVFVTSGPLLHRPCRALGGRRRASGGHAEPSRGPRPGRRCRGGFIVPQLRTEIDRLSFLPGARMTARAPSRRSAKVSTGIQKSHTQNGEGRAATLHCCSRGQVRRGAVPPGRGSEASSGGLRTRLAHELACLRSPGLRRGSRTGRGPRWRRRPRW